MRMRITFVVVLCAVFLACLGGVALAEPTPPFDTNAECLECHSVAVSGPAVSKVDFAVGAVDYNACIKCHKNLPDLVLYAGKYEANHYHFGFLYCTDCHNGGDAFAFVEPAGAPRKSGYLYSTPLGFFATTTSTSASAADLHRYHNGSGWVERTFSANYPGCSNCHAAAACSACHTNTVAHTSHATPTYPGTTHKQATGTSVTYAPSTCTNASCHPVAAAGTSAFIPRCTSCHPVQIDTHGYDEVDHVADDGTTAGIACSACHALDLSTEHAKPSSSSTGSGCATCHPAPRNTFAAWDQGCVTGGCHTAASSAPVHEAAGEAHAVVPAGEVCLGCHEGADLVSVHAGASDGTGATSCLVCHKGGSAPATSDCTVCHFTFEGHYDETLHTSTWTLDTCGGAACHTTNDLMGVHAERNPAFTCAGCHSSTDPNVGMAITSGTTACDACHTGVSESQGHRSVHWANPALVSGDPAMPNYAYTFGTTGGVPTADCAGCHTSNLLDEHMGVFEDGTWSRLPRTASDGSTLDCASCHASLDPAIGTAIALGQTRCDACHVVHNTIPATHASTYADDKPIDCSGCHASDLSVVHGPTMTTTTESGRVLSGCGVCHDNTEGERGTQVQSAISVTNDTRCTACHPQYHSGTSSHEATTSASVTGCGPCHGSGGPSIDVTEVHAGVAGGGCSVCHNNPSRVGDIGTKTAECASCHATQGTDYHRQMAVKHVSSENTACNTCHHGNRDVSVVHRSVGCLVCHNGTTVTEGTTAACANCHPASQEGETFHLTIDTAHTPQDTASLDCARCHQTTDIREVHVTNACQTCHNGLCGDCHAMHGGMSMGAYLLRSTACASCHPVAGTDYHSSMSTKHTYTAMDPGCVAEGCHVANTLPEAHAPYLAHYPQYTDTCALCHLNEDSARIDWSTASADCSTCHEGHGDLGVIHTPTTSDACVRCHAPADVRELHPACSTCHNATVNTSGTVDCANCHAEQGTDFHTGMNASHVGFTSAGCAGVGCHPSGNVVDAHARYVGPGKQFSQYADTCALCHLNTDPNRINWSTIQGATCGNCHGYPHDRMKHAATSSASQECVACHETNWVPQVHGVGTVTADNTYKCNICHDNPTRGDLTWDKTTSDCEQCHDALPVAEKHYPVATHTATDEGGCSNCHYLEMMPEHSKPTAGPVSCVTCHETKVDAFTTAWDKTCTACHTQKHADKNASHVSANTECGGSGCHDISDVSVVHRGLQGGGCKACHTGPDTLPTSTDCTTCHTGFGSDHHELHNTAPVDSSGCNGCHFGYIDDEHAALGLTCATCHESANGTVQAAIAAGDVRCLTCHPNSEHNALQTWEFDAGNASMHRVGSTKPGMRSVFNVNGTNYTMTLPAASTFLKTGYTYDTMLTCTSCHSYTSTGGPHGASVTVNFDPAYTADWKTAYLYSTSTGMARSGNSTASDVICAKCHDLSGGTGWNSSWSNKVHAEGDHQGATDGKCVFCHTQVPHGWGRPRLLGSTKDPLAYRTSGALIDFKLRSYTPNSWDEGDCSTACGEHGSAITPAWPSVMKTAPASLDANNLAAGRAFTANRYASTTYVPGKAGDLDLGTYWWSNTRGSATAIDYLIVDLDSSLTVSKFQIDFYGELWAKEYRIYTSTTGSYWTQVYATTNGTAGTNTATITARSARWVKVECRRTGTGRSEGYGIAELRVYR